LFAFHRSFWQWIERFYATMSSTFLWYIIRVSWWGRYREIRVIEEKGRVNMLALVFEVFQGLVRQLISTSGLKWFKIFIGHDV
jgi:hypothetical protein